MHNFHTYPPTHIDIIPGHIPKIHVTELWKKRNHQQLPVYWTGKTQSTRAGNSLTEKEEQGYTARGAYEQWLEAQIKGWFSRLQSLDEIDSWCTRPVPIDHSNPHQRHLWWIGSTTKDKRNLPLTSSKDASKTKTNLRKNEYNSYKFIPQSTGLDSKT